MDPNLQPPQSPILQLWTYHKKLVIIAGGASIFFLITFLIFLLLPFQSPINTNPSPSPTPRLSVSLPPMKTFDNHSLRISYPSNWQAQETGLLGRKGALFVTDEQKINSLYPAKLFIQEIPKTEDPTNEIEENEKRGYEKQLCTYSLPSCTLLAKKFTFKGIPLYEGVIIFGKDNVHYMIVFSYLLNEQQVKNEAILTSMLNSLTLP